MGPICEITGGVSKHNEQIENNEVGNRRRGSMAVSDMESKEIEVVKGEASEFFKGLYECVPQENNNIREFDNTKTGISLWSINKDCSILMNLVD